MTSQVSEYLECIMVGMFIGQYLLVNGHISRDQLLAAVENQKKQNSTLEEIALEENFLDANQIDMVDTIRRYSGDSFEEIVLAKKLLDEEQLGKLVKLQKDRNIMLGQSMVQLGIMTMERFDELFEKFRQDQKKYFAEVNQNVISLEKNTVLNEMYGVVSRLFNNIIGQPLKFISHDIKDLREPIVSSFLYSQKIVGPHGGHIVIDMPDKIALEVASSLMRKAQFALEGVALDSVAEFLNMIIGHFCINMSVKGEKYNAEPPYKHIKSGSHPFKNMLEGLVLSSTEGEVLLAIVRDDV
jgi:CheY-specific phosphatase CheX